MKRTQSTRRDFLEYGLIVTASSVCCSCSQFGSRKSDLTASKVNGKLSLSESESLALLDSQGSFLVQSKDDGDKILVIHSGNGNLFAVSSMCTHKGCDVYYDKKVGQLICPCHRSKFDLDGQNIKGPAKSPLKQYTVLTENNMISIIL